MKDIKFIKLRKINKTKKGANSYSDDEYEGGEVKKPLVEAANDTQ